MAEQVEPSLDNSETVELEERKEKISLKDDVVALNRFLFMGSVNPCFNTIKSRYASMSFYYADQIGQHLNSLATSYPSAIVNMAKKALESESLRTKEYLMFIVAYTLRLPDCPELKKEVRMSLHQLVVSPDDFLQFMFFYKNINAEKITFGRGMREAVKKFYNSKSPTELLEIVFATESVGSIRHADVLHLAHTIMENEDKNEIIKASRLSYEKIKAAAESSTTMKKILKYKDLKRCQEAHGLVSILKRKDFVYKLNHLPTNALKSPEVIELILPNMSLSELLSNLEKLCTNQMLRIQSPVAKKICNALQCSNKVINEAKLNPLYVFQILRTLEKKMTLETPAADETSDKTKDKEKKFSNPFIIKKLQQIFNQTMNEQPKTGCRYYVTLDFRKFSDRQFKKPSMKNVSRTEVQAIVALTLLKNEKDVTVMSFSDDRNQLKPVAWTSETTFEKAMEICENEIKTSPKIKEHVVLPMRKATLDKKKVDVFVTFVSSIGRTMGRHCKPPLQQLNEYRAAMKMKMAKFVVVNLSRPSPDFKYDKENIDETGILEIVGFSPDSMKVIEAYAKNCFV